jgi:hypothetical protein
VSGIAAPVGLGADERSSVMGSTEFGNLDVPF